MTQDKERLASHIEKLKNKNEDTEEMKLVFTTQSKIRFYCRDAVCQYVFGQGCIPLNPYRMFDYDLNGSVDPAVIRKGRSQLIKICSELWVFGSIANEMLQEITEAIDLGKHIRFFTISTKAEEIREVDTSELVFEPEVHAGQISKQDVIDYIENGMPGPDKKQYSQMELFEFMYM